MLLNTCCPACGFLVYNSAENDYQRCPVCEWENDPIQHQFPNMQCGSNLKSLFEYQKNNQQRFSDPSHSPADYQRDNHWQAYNETDFNSDGTLK